MSLSFVILLFALSFYDGNRVESSCGVPAKPSGLSFGAIQSDANKWPWHAVIYRIVDDKYFCGGTLVSATSVITAAHCLHEKNQPEAIKANEVVVKLGKHDLSVRYERGSVLAYPSSIKIHEDWKNFTQNFDSDIAIITLEFPVQFSFAIYPICIWQHLVESNATSGFIVGYGMSETGLPNKPRELELDVHSNEDCFLKNNRLALLSSRNTFCAGKDSLSGPCLGDSGGGLFISHSNRWYLRGITSSTLIIQGRCDLSSDAVFTNVLKFTKWISSNVQLPEIIPENLKVATNRPKKEIFCSVNYRQSGRESDSFNVEPAFEHCTIFVNNELLLSHHGGEEISFLYKPEEIWKISAMKKKHPHLLMFLLVKESRNRIETFSQIITDSSRRIQLAENLAAFLKKQGFDGMFFHLIANGRKSEDRQNSVELLRNMNTVFKAKNLYLTVELKAVGLSLEQAFDIKGIVPNVDYIIVEKTNLLNGQILFTAPLSSSSSSSIESAVEELFELGAPAEKLILSFSFVGCQFATKKTGKIGDRIITIHDQKRISFYNPYEVVKQNEICEYQDKDSWRERFDLEAAQSIGTFKSNGGLTYGAIFESPRSIAHKVRFAMEKNLAGVLASSINFDDVHGECDYDNSAFVDFRRAPLRAKRQKTFPLLKTITEAIKLLE